MRPVHVRYKSAAIFTIATITYGLVSTDWLAFIILFLIPDIGMIGYLIGPRTGRITYNALHTYPAPIILLTAGAMVPAIMPFALIWIAHIGLDRALGYGLKRDSFHETHLGTI